MTAKRGLDVVVAMTALVLVSPLLLLVAALVRLTSSGPALFRQTRVGQYGRTFEMLKFRTMRDGCDDGVHREYVERMLTHGVEPQNGLYKLDTDPRITRVGALLRRTSIDEIPQLLNVIRGEMSLVGPRPALPFEAQMFPAWAASRFTVQPGLTGMWQVNGRNRLTMIDGLRLDVEYVARRTLLLDLAILARTVPAVLGGGAR
ncbi:MAG TPA: sugar transferase [Marmoricola sp.]|jgi:lipopolysaccharide/colanic/teichoic acid biosynthesis glycosyltransferase|nr:sugar transferase [Marmoricola sp.]